MSRTALAFALSFALTAASSMAFAHQDGESIDKVNGSITAAANQSYGDLETVNGSIDIESSARTGNAETVNGNISADDHVSVGSLSTVNGSIRVGTQARIARDVETVNGSVFIDNGGDVGGGIETVNGAIGLVDTDLAGGIETVNGDITVGIGSHVKGGIRIEKPHGWSMQKRKPNRIIIGPNAQVDGALVFERPVVLYVHSTAKVGPITGATAIAYSTARAPTEE